MQYLIHITHKHILKFSHVHYGTHILKNRIIARPRQKRLCSYKKPIGQNRNDKILRQDGAHQSIFAGINTQTSHSWCKHWIWAATEGLYCQHKCCDIKFTICFSRMKFSCSIQQSSCYTCYTSCQQRQNSAPSPGYMKLNNSTSHEITSSTLTKCRCCFAALAQPGLGAEFCRC